MKVESMISPNQAASLLGLKPRTIQAWLRLGKLNGIKMGSIWRIRMEDINRLLLAGNVPSPKLERVSEPLLSIELEDSQVVSLVESATGLVLVVVNGKPKAAIQLPELSSLLQAAIQSISTDQDAADLVSGM